MYFDYNELPEALQVLLGGCMERVVLRTPMMHRRFIEELLERMAEEYRENGEHSGLLHTYFHALIVELSRFSEEVPEAETASDAPVMQVVKYINENYAEDISAEELAAMVFLSRAHFCRRFKKVTGFSPLEYIHSVRLKAAETLLETTDKSITEIAILSGFPGGNYFGDFFKKYRGMSPREWRKSFRK